MRGPTNISPVLVRPPASAPVPGTNDLRPIKPPVEIPSGWAWVWWTLGALVLAAGLFLLWRRWKQHAARPPLLPIIPPHVRARQRLEEALHLLSDPRLFCIAVSDALRAYLEERFRLRAPERTTEEFLQDLQRTSHLNADQKLGLTDFLAKCDLAKFARFEPTEAALRELHEAALRLVDETKYEPTQPPAPPALETRTPPVLRPTPPPVPPSPAS